MEYNWFDETEARMGITRTATPTLTEGEDGIVCVVRARRSHAMPCHEKQVDSGSRLWHHDSSVEIASASHGESWGCLLLMLYGLCFVITRRRRMRCVA